MHLSYTAALELSSACAALSQEALLKLPVVGCLNHKALGLSLVAALVSYSIAKNYPPPKSFEHIPMPPVKTKGILGLLLGHQADDMNSAYGDLGTFYMDVHGHGGIDRVSRLRIGPSTWIVATHPGDVQHVHHSENYVRPFVFKLLLGRLMGDSVACTLDVGKHKLHRRLMTPAFSPSALKGIADEVVTKHAGIFMEAIRTHAKDGKPFVVQKELYQPTVQVIADAIFNSTDLKDTEKIVGLFEKAIEGQWTFLRLVPGLDSLLFARNKKVGDARAVMAEMVRKIITDFRQAQAQDPNTAASSLMEHLVAINKLSETDLLDNGITFMFAGQETTQTSMNWFSGYMGRNPAVQAKLYEELCDAIGKNTQCRLGDLKSCKFLVNCIKESIRLRCPIGISSRTTVEDDVLPATKTFVPKGSQVALSYWVPLHHPKIWGPDAEEYRPERWDEFTPEQRDMVELAWLPFSSGLHGCLGKEFAMNELMILAAVLVRNFEVQFPEGDPEPLPIQIATAQPKEPLRIIVSERPE